MQDLAQKQTQNLAPEPYIWRDHEGNAWQLSKMQTTHLINILRLVVNRWVLRYGLAPVPIKNPQAILDPARIDEDLAPVIEQMARAILYRLAEGEQLPPGYAVVWSRVVAKIRECLIAQQLSIETPLISLLMPAKEKHQ